MLKGFKGQTPTTHSLVFQLVSLNMSKNTLLCLLHILPIKVFNISFEEFIPIFLCTIHSASTPASLDAKI